MGDLINKVDAKFVIKQIAKQIENEGGMEDSISYSLKLVYDEMDEIPTVDAEPVRHGQWVEIEENATGHLMECSVCKEWIFLFHNFKYASNYCPNCGAKMDKEAEK